MGAATPEETWYASHSLYSLSSWVARSRPPLRRRRPRKGGLERAPSRGGAHLREYFECCTTRRSRLNVSENPAAALDLDLAVTDRPRDPAGRSDQQPVVDDEVTLEAATDLSLVDSCLLYTSPSPRD